jgi:hypothetical protein
MNKLVKFTVFLFILFASSLPGFATCSGSGIAWSCTSGSTAAQVNTVIGSASDGAVVTFANGSYSWSSTISFSLSTGITFICANGATCTVTSSAIAAFGFPTGSSTKLYRISGFTFPSAAGTVWTCPAGGCTGTITQFRFDHNTCTGITASATVITIGENTSIQYVYGVIDHNTFSSASSFAAMQVFGIADASAPASAQGTISNMFMEDNTITVTTMTDSGTGAMDGWGPMAAVVFRHNTVTNALVTIHSAETVGGHGNGAANWEVYNNHVIGTSGSAVPDGYRLIHHQGSFEEMYFNNTFTPFTEPINSDALSLAANYPPQYTGSYPTIYQPGRDYHAHLLYPVYGWNNRDTINGNKVPEADESGFPTYFAPNRDWYDEVGTGPQSSTTSPFNGTSGVGFGTLARRPSTCTPTPSVLAPDQGRGGVGYFATDQGTQGILYSCTSTNTWGVWYTPYTYPHPLISSAASTPTFSPGAGTYSGAQNVTLHATSGGVICWNTAGAPATDGVSGCTTGTPYTGPVGVPITETLFAIAGGTGFTDSAVGSAAYVINPAQSALPALKVDNNECNTNFTYTLAFPTSWASATPVGWPTALPYANTDAGVQQALLDMDTYRTSTGKGTRIHIPARYVYSEANGPWINQTSTVAATQCNVIDSTEDGSLPIGRTVGSHGIQDDVAGNPAVVSTSGVTVTFVSGTNFKSLVGAGQPVNINGINYNTASSWSPITPFTTLTLATSAGAQTNVSFTTTTDIGLHNPSNDGLNMYDELGPQNIGGVITGVTTLDAHTTTLAAITLNASPQLVALANGYVSPGNSYVVDTGVNAETVVAVSGVNQTGLYGVFTLNHASGVTVTYDIGTITLANGTVVHTSDYNDVQHMWTAESTAANASSIRFCSPVGGQTTAQPSPQCTSTTLAPDHWLIMDMEARPKAVFVNGSTPTPVLMTGSGAETACNQYPQHIHFRKDWSHSDWTSLASGLNPVGNLMFLNGSYVSVLDTQAGQAIRPGAEGHIILMEGCGPYKMNHNWLEGMSIGMFSGGPGGILPVGLQQIFQDVEARRYKMGRPYTWLGGNLSGNPHFAGNSTVFKNFNELKNGQRVLHSGYIWENIDGSGGQSGPQGDVTDRNCSAATPCSNYNTIITDAIFEYGILRNSCIGMEFDRSNLAIGNGNGVAYGVYRSTLRHLLTYGISGHNPGCSIAGNIKGIALSNGSKTLWQGTIKGDGTTATFVANCSVQQGGCPGHISSIAVNAAGTGCVAGSLVIPAPNISGGTQAAGTYTCTSGALATVTLTAGGTGYTSTPSVTLATGTGTVTVTMVTSPTAPTIGAEVFDMQVGDPVAITMCNGTPAFNNVTTSSNGGFINPSQRGPLATAASAPWTGTGIAGNLTVSFPSTVTGTDNGGFCTISGLQGGPFNLTLQHVTQITDNTGPALTSNNSPSGGFNFQMNAAVLDSIMLGGNGWLGGSVTEGTQTENLNYDSTTMAAHHLVWPIAVASNYTEYGNNPNYPDSAGCTGAGCHNPVTMYFPTATFCSGAIANSNCIGFSGAMSAASMPITLPDYHSFALDPTSLFKGGGTQQASDGTDMGPNISAIDAAQTRNQYNAPGFFPDVQSSGPPPTPHGLTVLGVGQ